MSNTSFRKYESAAVLTTLGTNRDFVEMSVEELAKIRNNNFSLFVEKYDGHLFCPECNIPQLSLCKKPNSDYMYLRGYPDQAHSDNCSMGLDEISTKSARQILEDDYNNELIKSRLQLTIKSLLKGNDTEYHPFVVRTESKRIDLSLIRRTDVYNNGTQKVIPSKSLNISFSEDDYNRPMIFYGKVKLRWRYKEDEKRKFYILTIYRKDTDTAICSSTVSVKKHDYITDTSDIDNAFVAFFSEMKLNNTYNNFNIEYSDKIIIERA